MQGDGELGAGLFLNDSHLAYQTNRHIDQ
jgi:hypothetical protein